MPRESLQTLTEPMYYVLLSLISPRCGIQIMEETKALSGGRVVVGPGTLYTMLAKFEENGIISPAPDAPEGVSDPDKGGAKRKHYIITGKGITLLRQEYGRLARMAEDGKRIMEVLQ